MSVFVVDEIDVELRRGDRWRVNPAVRDGLPDTLKDLTSGHQHGTVNLA